jgi:hypothetical protein
MARTSVALKGAGMKSRIDIWLSALEEFGALCAVDTRKDAERVLARFEDEGVAFLTVTLPTMARDLERALSYGELSDDLFVGFKRKTFELTVSTPGAGVKTKKWSHRGAPVFLQGFFEIIFDVTPEWTYDDYVDMLNVDGSPAPKIRCTDDEEAVVRIACAIWAIRQLSLLFSKEKELCSDDKVEEAIRRYVQLDEELMLPLPMTVWYPSSSGTT